MGNNIQLDKETKDVQYELKDIIEFKGNDEEFKLLNENLNKPFEHTLIFEDEEKRKLKYMGQLSEEKYEGRGILYSNYTLDGYFKDGLMNGYFRVYKNNSKDLIYEGFYLNNQYHGKGILYNGRGKKVFDGCFKFGKRHGIGIEYFHKGILKRKMVYNGGNPLKECFGELYDEKNNLIYQGLLIDLRPSDGKGITIYDRFRCTIYIGDISNFEYNGKGILFYERSNKEYFDGFFEMGSFIYGSLYNPQGNKLYEGEFIDNKPKESKNIKLYELNMDLKFEGGLSEGKYHGNGKLYQDKKLIYEGNFQNGLYGGNGILYLDEISRYEGFFKEGKFHGHGKIIKEQYIYFEGEYLDGKKHGKGKIFYPNKKVYFDGYYENNEKKGEGIRYYDNGSKKIVAFYNNSLSCKGKYYSPDNELLYEGDMIDEIPCNDNIKIYNDYTYKICTLEKKEKNDSIYNIIDLEYFPNYYMSERLKLKYKFKIPFISFDSYSGKTVLINRLIYKTFHHTNMGTTSADFLRYSFEKNNNKYIGCFYDLPAQTRIRSLFKDFVRGCNIAIFTVNIYENKEIEEYVIDAIRKEMDEKSIIYMVGNRFGYSNRDFYSEKNRNIIKELINKDKIYKYFEVDASSGQGIENLIRNIEFDILAFSRPFENINKNQKK